MVKKTRFFILAKNLVKLQKVIEMLVIKGEKTSNKFYRLEKLFFIILAVFFCETHSVHGTPCFFTDKIFKVSTDIKRKDKWVIKDGFEHSGHQHFNHFPDSLVSVE